MNERLQKIISRYGIASRRASEKMISDGRIAVNGITAALGGAADPEKDVITIDGKPLSRPPELLYIMLNKPKGYVTTMKDEKGRKNVTELVEGCGRRVYPVGRLDMDSEGLLLMTNDGQTANAVMHPRNRIEKTYIVRVKGALSDLTLKSLSSPMELDGYVITPARVRLIKPLPDGGILEIRIFEGRNRQIRKMCALCDLTVHSLKRERIGTLELKGLETGKWRYLSKSEINYLYKF